MARQRDYRAEYEARRARAQAAGHTGYRSQRAARAAGREPGGRRQIHTSPAGTVVTTTAGGRGFGVIEAQLRAHPSARVRVLVTYTDGDGRTRQANLYGKGGREARRILAAWGDDPAQGIADDIESGFGSGTGYGVTAVLGAQVVIY